MSLGQAVVEILSDLSGFEQRTKRDVTTSLNKSTTAATRAAENLGRKTGERLSGAMNKAAKVGVATVIGTIGTALVKGFTRLDAIDQARKKMEGLGHSTAVVEKVMENALNSVRGTAFGLGDAAGLAATLVAAGIKPGQHLEATLKRVADAATIAGTDLGDMGAIWSKAAAKGRIDGELLNQMIERQIPIFDILGKHYGKTAEEVSDMVRAGQVNFKAFSDAMNTYVGGAALKSGETFRGALANMGAALGRLGASMLEGVFPQIRAGFVDVTQVLDSFAPAAKRVGEVLGNAFRVAYQAVSQFVTGLTTTDPATPLEGLAAAGQRVREVFLAVWERVQPLIESVSGLGVSGFVGFAAALAGVAAKAGTLMPFLTGIAGAFPKISSAVSFLTGPLGIVAALFGTAYATSEPFREAVNSLLVTLGGLAAEVGTTLAPVLSDLAVSLLPSLVSVADSLAPVIAAVADKLASLATILAPYSPQILAVVSALVAYRKASALIRGGLIAERVAWTLTKVTAIKSMGETIALRALYAADAVKTSARVVAAWVAMGARAMANGARMAAAWVLAMGPVGWIITGLVAVGAGLVALWQRSETFRNIVTGVWERVKAAVASVVSFFTDTVGPMLASVWNGITTAVGTVRDVVVGVFSAIVDYIVGVFSPWMATLKGIFEFTWKAIWILILAAWTYGIKPVFDAIGTAISAVGSFFSWLYNSAIKPAFTAVGNVISTVWRTVVSAVFTAINAALAWVGRQFNWFYNSVIKPVWNGIRSTLSTVWNWISRNIFDRIAQAVGWLGDRFRWFRDSVIVPVWNAIKNAIKAAVDWITGTVFGGFRSAISAVGDAFETVKDAIGTAWGAIKELAKQPVKFVINTVLNNGLIKAFNWLSDKIGGPTINAIPLPAGFRDGGILPGYTPGRDVHRFFSPTGGVLALSGGEPILRPEAGRVLGPGWVHGINRAARTGGMRGVAKFLSNGGGFASGGIVGQRAFASGGVLGWIKSKASSAFNWVRDKAGAVWQAISDPIGFFTSKIPAMDTAKTIAKYGEAAVLKAKDAVVERIKGLWETFKGAFDRNEAEMGATPADLPTNARGLSFRGGVRLDGNTLARLVQAAKTVAMHVIQGSWQNYHLSAGTHLGSGAVDLITSNYPLAVRALRATGLLAMFRNWPGNRHIHALNPHVNGLSQAALAQVATARRNNGTFRSGGIIPIRSYDRGGWLGPGWTLAHNGTGRPERVGNDTTTYLTVNMEVAMRDLSDIRSMREFLRMLETSRVERRRTARSGTVTA